MESETEAVRCTFCNRRMNHITPDGHLHCHKTCAKRNGISLCPQCEKPVLCNVQHAVCAEQYRRDYLEAIIDLLGTN